MANIFGFSSTSNGLGQRTITKVPVSFSWSASGMCKTNYSTRLPKGFYTTAGRPQNNWGANQKIIGNYNLEHRFTPECVVFTMSTYDTTPNDFDSITFRLRTFPGDTIDNDGSSFFSVDNGDLIRNTFTFFTSPDLTATHFETLNLHEDENLSSDVTDDVKVYRASNFVKSGTGFNNVFRKGMQLEVLYEVNNDAINDVEVHMPAGNITLFGYYTI